MYLKYTSEFKNKYISIESPLQVYFWVWKEIRQLRKYAATTLLSFNADL